MKPAELAVAKRRPSRTGKRGGQKGNANALKTGVWSAFAARNLDGRTAMAKSLAATRQLLVDALGGKPTPQQGIIIERAVYKSFRCGLFETAHLNGTGDGHSAASDVCYLAWANSLRLDLAALGLDGVPNAEPEQGPLIRIQMVPASDGEISPASEEQRDRSEPDEAHPTIRVRMVAARTKDEPAPQQTPPKPQPKPQPSREPEWPEPEPDDRNASRTGERKTFIPIATWGVS